MQDYQQKTEQIKLTKKKKKKKKNVQDNEFIDESPERIQDGPKKKKRNEMIIKSMV